MIYQNLKFWRNSRRFISLVVGMLYLITAVPAYAELKLKNRKPASGYSRAAAGASR
ncbi:MAG: hypothetical protein QNJ47_18395 [Nostocaceae cyanobacterium]|nr:hypothetical protein [Nostocaceae cyanobacterium]